MPKFPSTTKYVHHYATGERGDACTPVRRHIASRLRDDLILLDTLILEFPLPLAVVRATTW